MQKKNYTRFVSDFTVTSLENTTELDDASTKINHQKQATKVISPSKINNRKSSMVRISNLDVNADPALTARKRTKNLSPD